MSFKNELFPLVVRKGPCSFFSLSSWKGGNFKNQIAEKIDIVMRSAKNHSNKKHPNVVTFFREGNSMQKMC